MTWCCQGSASLWWTVGAGVVIVVGTIVAAYLRRSAADSIPTGRHPRQRHEDDPITGRAEDAALTHPEPRATQPPDRSSS